MMYHPEYWTSQIIQFWSMNPLSSTIFVLIFLFFFFFFFLLIVICYNNSLITTIIADVV